MDAIGTHQYGTTFLRFGAVGQGEARRDPVGVLRETRQSMTVAQGAGWQSRLRRAPQDAMQPATMDRELGGIVPGPESALAGPHLLAEMIQIAQLARADGNIVEFQEILNPKSRMQLPGNRGDATSA